MDRHKKRPAVGRFFLASGDVRCTGGEAALGPLVYEGAVTPKGREKGNEISPPYKRVSICPGKIVLPPSPAFSRSHPLINAGGKDAYRVQPLTIERYRAGRA